MCRFQIILQTAEGWRPILIESSSNGEPAGCRYQGQEFVDGAVVTFDDETWLVSLDTETEAPWPRFLCSPVRSQVSEPKTAPALSLALTLPRPSANS